MDAHFLAADLKKADPDRFLLSLFASREHRPALWALFLLNHEIAKTRAVVSDTNLGHIRLQWWRDGLTNIYQGGNGGNIPVLSTLAPVIHAQTLPQEWFESLIYAREFDLEDVAPASLDGLRAYADFTTTPLNRLALKIVGQDASEGEITQISTNFGLIEAVRAVPLMLRQRRCLLPDDLLRAKNLSPQKIWDFNHKEEIVEIVEKILECVTPYRNPESRFLKIQQAMTLIYLNKIRKIDFDVFSVAMQVPPALFALRLTLTR